MKIAFKNFITTLRRYKMASVLNIAGLTLAFTAFYVMMVQVTYDLGYNRSIRDADRIWTSLRATGRGPCGCRSRSSASPNMRL